VKATSYYSQRDRTDVVELHVTDMDKADAVNSREIIRRVRDIVAERIADILMKKIGPVIEDALSLVTSKTQEAKHDAGTTDIFLSGTPQGTRGE
jgi:hypothetical protein